MLAVIITAVGLKAKLGRRSSTRRSSAQSGKHRRSRSGSGRRSSTHPAPARAPAVAQALVRPSHPPRPPVVRPSPVPPEPAQGFSDRASVPRPNQMHRPAAEVAVNAGARVAAADQAWVPAGQTLSVGGFAIAGGLIYVGRQLCGAATDEPDPALINPSLPVNSHVPDSAGRRMDYWPSYSRISPECRAAYLQWLAGGRHAHDAYIGYVFLYFYGLERRLLVDAQRSDTARAEHDMLVSEIRRLLGIYGHNHSFRRYAEGLLAVTAPSGRPRYLSPPPTTRLEGEGWVLPFDLRLGLGQLIADGKPIPADWALARLRLDPEVSLRTPATRCPDEFAEIFARRYRDRYGPGLLVKANRGTLAGAYTPASAGFAGQAVRFRTGVPDVTVLSEPVAQLRNVAEEACAELDAYSRYLGRHPEAVGTAAALALLPPGIDRPADATTAALLTWADDNLGDSDQVDVAGAELLARWPATASGRIARSDAVTLARLLDRKGVGLEPDVRFGGPVPTGHVRLVLFRRVTEVESVPSESYRAGAAVAELAAVVAAADGSISAIERDLLVREVTATFGLADEEQRRLRAHLAFVLTQPPTAAALRKHTALLTDAQRRDAGELLAAIAGADGTVNQAEIDSLRRQFTILGLDPAKAYGSAQAADTISGDTLTTLQTVGAPAPSYAIPQPPQPQPDHGSTAVFLDPQLVKQRLVDSDRVATYLAELFTDEDEAADGQSHDSSAAGPDQGSAGLVGLDPVHSTLLRRLAQRPQWTRQEFDNIAAEFGLLPDGAWETLNEASVDTSGEPVCEGADPVQLNSYALEEMLR